MPGNSDLGLVREVSQIARELPIIIMTGHPTVESAVRSLQLTVTAYLVKPFERETLLVNVERAIRGFHAIRTVQNAQNRVEEWRSRLGWDEHCSERPSTSGQRHMAHAFQPYGSQHQS
jgi:DNA-binding NtrC family response regulator